MDYILEKAEDGRLFTTHQNIAKDLGTAREVISRLLKDFERRGFISISRNLIQLTQFAYQYFDSE
jgi:CRP/FNR family transcriptional regulator